MTEWKSLRIPEETYAEHNERRKEMGLTWEEYIDGQAPEYVEEQDVIRDAIQEELESILGDELWDTIHAELEAGETSLGRSDFREIVREETRAVLEEVARA